ncbi:MAG: transglutaminase family protein [Bacteroides sp.]|jgi:hypothetical protein
MNRTAFLIAMLAAVLLASCTEFPGLPSGYRALVDSALVKAGSNRPELENALKNATPATRKGVAFLIAYMPQRDLESMRSDDLLANVGLAYEARNRFAWAREVPDSIFLNDVLPYAVLNEERDQWREQLYHLFTPYVDTCRTLEEAIMAVNRNIAQAVKVEYNTAREKPDQNPSESMRQGMASCSGLSILLVDALRAVGIPARIAGTANWHDNRGNHNWCEVWAGGQWHFTEYYPDTLDRAWFLPDAGKADANDRAHAIWASSFKPTGESFPLVWDSTITYVPALNVTPRYIALANSDLNAKLHDGKHVPLRVRAVSRTCANLGNLERVAVNVDIFCNGEQIGGGRTSNARQDENDVLTFMVEKNKTYSLRYTGALNHQLERTVMVKDEPEEVVLEL